MLASFCYDVTEHEWLRYVRGVEDDERPGRFSTHQLVIMRKILWIFAEDRLLMFFFYLGNAFVRMLNNKQDHKYFNIYNGIQIVSCISNNLLNITQNLTN